MQRNENRTKWKEMELEMGVARDGNGKMERHGNGKKLNEMGRNRKKYIYIIYIRLNME
jgi:hypothetical protein